MRGVILSLLLISFISCNSYSQCVSIELSIEWRKEKSIFSNEYDTICIPYLNITYRNNKNIPLYFLKVSGSRMGLPELPSGTLMYRNPDLYERAMNHLDFSNNNYKVEIGGFPYYGQGWVIINDTVTAEEVGFEIINDDLADIYEYIFQKIYAIPKPGSALYLHYKASDITEKGILTTLKDQFVFLKAGEIFTDRYNLVGFNMVGGHFDFSIKVDSLYGFVYTEHIWDEKQGKWIYKKTDLPNRIKEYYLYKGDFYSYDIEVEF